MPESWVKKLRYRFTEEILVEYPAMAVRTIIDETLQKNDGLRPFEEYQQAVQAACPIRKQNPHSSYSITKKKLGKGGFGTIYKCQRK